MTKPDPREELWDPRAVTVAVGIRRAGKSTKVKRLIAGAACDAVTFDPHDEWGRDGRATGEVELGTLDRIELADFLERAPELVGKKGCRLAVVPSEAGPDGSTEEFCEFAEAFTEAARARRQDRPLIVWVSEAHLLDNAQAGKWLDFWATQSAHVGEGFGLGLDAQRAKSIRPTTRTQAEFAFFFSQFNALDLDAVRDIVGVTAPELPRELPELKRFHYRFWMSPARAGAAREE